MWTLEEREAKLWLMTHFIVTRTKKMVWGLPTAPAQKQCVLLFESKALISSLIILNLILMRALKIYIDNLYVLLGAEFHDHWPKLPSQSLRCSSALQRHSMSSDLSCDWHITGLLRKRLNYRRDLSIYAQVQTHNCPPLLWAPVLESYQQ